MGTSKRSPINTSEEAKRNPGGFLLDAMVQGSSNAILKQEAQGQCQLVNSDTLPTEMGVTDRTALESAGVKFGEPVNGDPIFTYVELPNGWKKVPTDHSMWSELLDEKGRKRASIFYKAAFYDRSAHLNADRRYSYGTDYDAASARNVVVSHVRDGRTVIFSTEEIAMKEGQHSWELSDIADKAAKDWLDAHYPDWHDASAYWD